MRERARRCQRNGRSAQTAEQTTDQHSQITDALYFNPHRIRGTRMLTHGAQTQAERGFEQDVPRHEDEN
ncbi:hypothetical protein D3C71_2083980 [compost metagenome]